MKVFGIAGWSNSGKTTLMIRLIAALAARGERVATIKHSHHAPLPGGDDAARLVAAGATEVMMAGPERFTLVHELRNQAEPDLPGLVRCLSPADRVLVEGFKYGSHPKLEVWDPDSGQPRLGPDSEPLVGLATDGVAEERSKPVVARHDLGAIVEMVVARSKSIV